MKYILPMIIAVTGGIGAVVALLKNVIDIRDRLFPKNKFNQKFKNFLGRLSPYGMAIFLLMGGILLILNYRSYIELKRNVYLLNEADYAKSLDLPYESLDRLNDLLVADPNDPLAHLGKGRLLEKQFRDFKGAEIEYKLAYDADNENMQILRAYGGMLIDNKEYTKGLQILEKYKALSDANNNQSGLADYYLGWAYLISWKESGSFEDNDNFKNAEKYTNSCIEKHKEYEDSAYYNRACLYSMRLTSLNMDEKSRTSLIARSFSDLKQSITLSFEKYPKTKYCKSVDKIRGNKNKNPDPEDRELDNLRKLPGSEFKTLISKIIKDEEYKKNCE